MTPEQAESQVRECYWDWHDFLANPRICRSGPRIAWNGYTGGIIRDPITYEKVRSLVETKQYSFQFAEDGSVFQLVYEFHPNNKLRVVRLAFYKAQLPVTEDMLESAGPLPDFSDIFVSWIRFDYAQEYASGILHHESHMHLSGFPDARFPVSGVPGPRQFVELVIAASYPEYYKHHRLDKFGRYVDKQKMKEVNMHCLPAQPKSVVEELIHIRVP